MSAHRDVSASRGSLPVWLALVVALPLGALLLTSLVVAALIAAAGAGIAALLLPRLLRGRPPRRRDDAIELDASQFRRLDERDRR